MMRTKLFIILGAIVVAIVLVGTLHQLSKNLPADISTVLENR
jgi:hypothetical protein